LDTEERGLFTTQEVPINKSGEVEDEAIPQRTGKR
jgi:hypothetical protein